MPGTQALGEQRRVPARGLHLLAEGQVTPALRTGLPASVTVGIPVPHKPDGNEHEVCTTLSTITNDRDEYHRRLS